MTNELVVSFHPDGTVQHTLKDTIFKPALGVQRDVERVSKIVHQKTLDFFYILGQMDPITGVEIDIAILDKYGVQYSDIPHKTDRQKVLMFGSYEDAVTIEVRLLNEMRLNGERFTQTIDGEMIRASDIVVEDTADPNKRISKEEYYNSVLVLPYSDLEKDDLDFDAAAKQVADDFDALILRAIPPIAPDTTEAE